MAAALRFANKRVTLIFPEGGIGARLFPADLARFLVDFYREKGVEVRPGEGVVGLERQGQDLNLQLQSGQTLTVQGVVAGIGVFPSIELAQQVMTKVGS